MKITLINPRVTTTPSYPMGLMYMASVLEQDGHKVRLIDSMAPDREIAESTDADMVGITITTPEVDRALNIAKEVKKASRAVIVAGGVHPSVRPNEILSDPNIDVVVIGEGEETIRELANHSESSSIKGIGYKLKGKQIFTKPRELIQDLDTIPYPAYHLLKSDIYWKPPKIRGTWTKRTAYLMASRGCPYHCAFCSSHLLFGRKVRRRSVQNVIDEIVMLKRTQNIDAVGFFDDTFTTDVEWVKEFCRMMPKGIKWTCQARVNTLMDKEMLKAMKESGCCQVDIGVESGSQRILNTLKKGITPEMTREAFRRLRAARIKTFVSLIVGVPGETKEDIEDTIRLLDDIKPDFADVFILTPYPGTDMDVGNTDYSSFIMNKHATRQAGNLNPDTIMHRKILRKHLGSWLKMVSFNNLMGIATIAVNGWRGWRGGIHGMLKEYRLNAFRQLKK